MLTWVAAALFSAGACTPNASDCPPPAPLPAVVSIELRPEPEADNRSEIDLDQFARQRRALDLGEALATLPGVVARSRNQDAQDTQISVRGFGARTPFGVRALRVEYDGIPATAADGQSQIGHIDVAGGGRMSLISGPFAALYGNGGAYLRVDGARGRRRDSERVHLALGSHQQQRLGFELAGGEGLSYALSANRSETAGQRAQSRSERLLASLRGDLQIGESGTLSLSANYQDQPLAQDPQGLTRSEFASNPDAASPAALLFNTGKSTTQSQLGARYQLDLDATRWDFAAYVGDRAILQTLSVPPPAQLAPTNGGGIVDLNRSFSGYSSSLERDLELLGRSAQLHAYLRHERLSEDRLGYENFRGNQLGVRGALRRNETNTGFATDGMLRLDLDLTRQLRLSAGARRGRVGYRSSDHYIVAGNPDDSGRFAAAAWLPVAGFAWRPLDGLELHGAVGRSQELPTLAELAYRDDGDGGFNTALGPARARQWEFGVRGSAPRWRVEATAFDVRGSDEIVVQSSAAGRTTFRNASGTRRRGLELAADWLPGTPWSARVVANWINARYTEDYSVCISVPCAQPDVLIAAGERMPGVPPRFGQVELSWQARADLSVGIEAQAYAATAASDRNRDQVPGYGVCNLRIHQRLPAYDWGQPSVLLRVDNLFDRSYSSALIVNESARRYYEAGSGRSVWVELNLSW